MTDLHTIFTQDLQSIVFTTILLVSQMCSSYLQLHLLQENCAMKKYHMNIF